jgi:hypothetical protein
MKSFTHNRCVVKDPLREKEQTRFSLSRVQSRGRVTHDYGRTSFGRKEPGSYSEKLTECKRIDRGNDQ